jgi:hypothetical protein
MKCILKLVQEYQPESRMIRLRNEFVPMDPKSWDAEFDVSINVGLGRGDAQKRQAALAQVAAKQEQVLTQMGLDNPLCTMGQYRATLAKMLDSSGLKSVDEFFLDPDNLPPELQQKIQQKMQAGQEQPNPLIEIEREKLQLKREMQMQEMQMKFEMRQQEMAYEAQLRGIEASSGANISTNIPRN